MSTDRDIYSLESGESTFDFQPKTGVYEFKHLGKNSFNLLLILSLASGGSQVINGNKSLSKKEMSKITGPHITEIVPSFIEFNNSELNLKPTPESISKPIEEVNSLISSIPEILYKTIDSAHSVNEDYLSSEIEPNLIKLSELGLPTLNSETKVNSLMKKDLTDLINQAWDDHISIYIRAGYRSFWEQQYALDKVMGDTSKVALPGQSQHQLGLAIDFSTSENQQEIGLYSGFENTKTNKWLLENAWKYGYVQPYINGHDGINPSAEPHHYLYVGQEMAKMYKELKDSGWEGDIFDLQKKITEITCP